MSDISSQYTSDQSHDTHGFKSSHNSHTPYSMLNKHNGFKFAHHNVRSLPSKIDQIKIALDGQPLDMLAINETWLDNTIRTEDVNIPGYRFERCDRSREGGGVAIYIKESLNYKLRKDLVNTNIEALWLEIRIPKYHKSLVVCSIYRPPSSNTQYIEHLIEVMDKINTDLSEIIILGDLNINLSLQLNNNQLGDICHLFDMDQLIREPTRITLSSSTIIDLILTTNPKLHVRSGIVNYNISDHYPVYTVLQFPSGPQSKPRQFKLRDYKNFNTHLFSRELSREFQNLDVTDDISTLWETFKSKLSNTSQKHAPIKEIRVKDRNNPWFNRDILEAQYKRDHLHKLSTSTGNQELYQQYRYMRNHVTSLIKRSQSEYYQHELRKNKNNSKKMWGTLRHLINKRRNMYIPPNLTAQQFNEYFIKIGKQLGAKFDS